MKMRRAVTFGMIVVAALGVMAEVSGSDSLEPVAAVDLTRYAGQWYEIARLPNRFQTSCAGEVTATYSMLPSRQIQVVNACRKDNGETMRAEGRARLAEPNGTGSRLKVRFAPAWLSWVPQVWADYWILALAPDYSYAVVGTPDRQYLWVLSRTPQMDEATYQRLTRQVSEKGFPTGKLVRTRQTRSK